ncbi:ABC transporter substrate-binding protein [Herpetosiphon sp. NSE202]|uniref:ABC transporter substrate-binding protein n=1 Tax=Herpetosiphon sp. NSE202 TaxID=3351349 RepID=UPI0036289207
MRRFGAQLLGLILLIHLLIACGTASETAQPTTSTNAASEQTANSNGVLRIGTGINLPVGLNVAQGSTGYNMVTYGAGETLMRFTVDNKLEPWLAESVSALDATTWQIKLRQGVRFHDGSELKASDVVTSFNSSWQNLSAAKNFIPADSKTTVIDDYTLILSTSQAEGSVPYSLANWNFVIHKPAVNGISVLTGMYQPMSLEKDQELVLERFANYWDGQAGLQKISVKKIPDANARSLALQSGDLDLLTNVAPDLASGLPADIELQSVAGTRMHYVMLDSAYPPFDDRLVRQAMTLAIDRQALLQATLDGQGAVATNLYPASVGIELVEAQIFDPAQAAKLLDQAGWVVGSDGMRRKNGQALAFTLHSYPGRAEITMMAIAIQAQLKELGIAVEVKEVTDIGEIVEKGNFNASMYSIGTSPDPQYTVGTTLIKGAAYNYAGYSNPAIESAFAELRAEQDHVKRITIAKRIQTEVKNDPVNIYLASPPLITAYRKGSLSGYVPNPNDVYLITKELKLNQ